jgi:hypothetical protein
MYGNAVFLPQSLFRGRTTAAAEAQNQVPLMMGLLGLLA